jgi:hypothetical protein
MIVSIKLDLRFARETLQRLIYYYTDAHKKLFLIQIMWITFLFFENVKCERKILCERFLTKHFTLASKCKSTPYGCQRRMAEDGCELQKSESLM